MGRKGELDAYEERCKEKNFYFSKGKDIPSERKKKKKEQKKKEQMAISEFILERVEFWWDLGDGRSNENRLINKVTRAR